MEPGQSQIQIQNVRLARRPRISSHTYRWIPYNSGIRQRGPNSVNTALQLVLRPHLLVHCVCCDDLAIFGQQVGELAFYRRGDEEALQQARFARPGSWHTLSSPLHPQLTPSVQLISTTNCHPSSPPPCAQCLQTCLALSNTRLCRANTPTLAGEWGGKMCSRSSITCPYSSCPGVGRTAAVRVVRLCLLLLALLAVAETSSSS
jgi:hypothetical protein